MSEESLEEKLRRFVPPPLTQEQIAALLEKKNGRDKKKTLAQGLSDPRRVSPGTTLPVTSGPKKPCF